MSCASTSRRVESSAPTTESLRQGPDGSGAATPNHDALRGDNSASAAYASGSPVRRPKLNQDDLRGRSASAATALDGLRNISILQHTANRSRGKRGQVEHKLVLRAVESSQCGDKGRSLATGTRGGVSTLERLRGALPVRAGGVLQWPAGLERPQWHSAKCLPPSRRQELISSASTRCRPHYMARYSTPAPVAGVS